MIQPEQRRTASSIKSISAAPAKVSSVFGLVLRSRKASPPNSIWPITYSDSAASSQSHHHTLLRNRFVTGNNKNTRNNMKATWMPRRMCVGMMVIAAYR